MGCRFAFVTFLTTLAAALPATALDRLIGTGNDHWLEVTGEGSVNAAPDFARVTLGVTDTGGRPVRRWPRSGKCLVSLIKPEGVAPADIQTPEVSISPSSRSPPPGQQTAPTITGYNVRNNVKVMVRDIPRLGGVLDKALAAGANSIYGVGFGHKDPSALLDKARPLAVADARRKADIYATAAGARIGRLMVLTEEPGPSADRLFSPRLCGRRLRSDRNRSGRGQADGDEAV